MTKTEDYYKILGVEKEASQDEIKKAFRQKAKQFHPDINNSENKKESESKFKKITEAYETLSDTNKRRRYDQFGTSEENFDHGFNGNPFFNNFFNFTQRESFFRQEQKRDINAIFEVSIEDAFNGVSKKVKFNREIICKKCDGSGFNTTKVYNCQNCQGTGVVEKMQNIVGMMTFVSNVECEECNGTGKDKKFICKKCNGKRKTIEEIYKEVNIKKGVRNGERIILKECGHQYEKKKFGNAVFSFRLKEHSFFKIKNSNYDIISKVKIPVHIGICGGEIKIPTLHGIKKMAIPKGTQQDSILVMKNCGYINGETSYTKMYVCVDYEIPTNLEENTLNSIKEIFKEENNYPEYKKMLERIG